VARRNPRYASFLVTGGLVGLLATAVVVLGPGADESRRGQLIFYLGILLVGIGALLGGLVAVLMEGRHKSPPRPVADDGDPVTDP
jgi:O-antigen ligase